MAAVVKASAFSKGIQPVVTGDCAGDVVVNDLYIDVTAAQLTLNAMFDIGPLPAGHKLVDCILLPDDLDTNGAPLVTLDVGMLTGTIGDDVADRTMDAVIFAASTAAQTGAAARPTLATAFKILPSASDRSIGVKVAAIPATAAAGRIRLRTMIAPAAYQQQF